jgi:hypothetical protein
MWEEKEEMKMAIDFRDVLRELEQEKIKKEADFKREMEGIEETISGLRKMLMSKSQPALFKVTPQHVAAIPAGKYSNMSVRWAILNLLAEDAVGPMPTGKIAEALNAGGLNSKSGKNFPSNVSAILSVMANTREEVESTENGYRLTPNGRAAWEGVKHTPQYANRLFANASGRPV